MTVRPIGSIFHELPNAHQLYWSHLQALETYDIPLKPPVQRTVSIGPDSKEMDKVKTEVAHLEKNIDEVKATIG